VIRIAPDQYAPTLAYLKEHRLLFEIQIDNIRPFIEADMKEMSERVIFNIGDHPSRITTDQYHNLDEINAYLDSLISTYPNLVTGVITGSSFSGAQIRAVKIGMPGGNNRPAVFIDGCLHAREWLSCATMIYILNELTTKQDQYANYLSNIDIYVLPVANVDGYTYTWTNNRLWRKTRSGPYAGNCYGVDPNRNWAYQWGVSGASLSPCDETYEGPSPFSEIETKSLADYICSHNGSIKSYMNIHTYSEDWMYPFGDGRGTLSGRCEHIACHLGSSGRCHSGCQRHSFFVRLDYRHRLSGIGQFDRSHKGRMQCHLFVCHGTASGR